MQPNHVHADALDVLAPLRQAERRLEEGEPLRDVHGREVEVTMLADEMTELLSKVERHTMDVELDPRETEMLVVALANAVWVARYEQMPRCADRMEELRHQIASGRRPMVLVFGLCPVCWPKKYEDDTVKRMKNAGAR
jgi:hypothetical protein